MEIPDDSEWDELGSFKVTDKDSGETTEVKLWQALNEDGSPAPEYWLNLTSAHRRAGNEEGRTLTQALYIPAEAMPELHWLIGKAAGDFLDSLPFPPGKCRWSREGGFRCDEDATARWTRDGWKNQDGTDRGHEETFMCETHKMGEQYGWVRHPVT